MNVEKTLMWFRIMQPFVSPETMPDIPKITPEIREEAFQHLERCGAIPKKDLIPGKTYEGSCRNTTRAVWTGEEFQYDRHKWGSVYVESINHYEDDLEYDVFVPIRMVD